jgi:hypothetical protein
MSPAEKIEPNPNELRGNYYTEVKFENRLVPNDQNDPPLFTIYEL